MNKVKLTLLFVLVVVMAACKQKNSMSTENDKSIFPKGEKASADYFTGTAWVKNLVPDDTTYNTIISDVVFEPGARNNWHKHPSGQILIVTAGVGYYQEKEKSIQLLYKGDVIRIAPNVVHWHGASRDSEFTHIAINPNTENGVVEWMQPVSDEEYNSYK
ncbi:(R)-mandelonitrile lyase [Paracnuella aquatica]|uniref:(R)-mandelonitrile lyase n=1 Tax=Paracnuella aquatica TaxID=2268757 RepID=UPI001F4EA9CD|nr:cupin domain-containing protein [Paracnuella aquatica]